MCPHIAEQSFLFLLHTALALRRATKSCRSASLSILARIGEFPRGENVPTRARSGDMGTWGHRRAVTERNTRKNKGGQQKGHAAGNAPFLRPYVPMSTTALLGVIESVLFAQDVNCL